MAAESRVVTLLPVDDRRGASTRARVLAHLPALEQAGYSPRLLLPLDLGRSARPLWRLADLLRDSRLDSRGLLFIHRKTYPPWFARRLRRAGRRIVYDFDDAIDLPPPGRELSARARRRYRRNFEASVEVADLVLCCHRGLAERVPHERVALLPTSVDGERFRPGALPPASGPVLGWVGHSDNLVYLERLAEPLRALAARHPGLRLVVVADRAPRLPGLAVEFRRWSLERELEDFAGIAVGLMPLDDTPWARSKCAYKALQYMALGIPAVASPVGMNATVIEHAVSGFLPRDQREWHEQLDALLGDAGLRARVAAAGREVVEREYSLERCSRRLLELLAQLRP